ncbi:DNA-binding protein [Serratia microhaemolytica]|uniref:DNA-binding protein n=1 Tax=Serratia microhaemolytica TaxID=2675110 RepID=UPI000FDDC49B|nr:DNA-binding protein [Serratia microhaemolytica]
MKNEWFAAKELIGLKGMPSSPQGVNQMARREGWVSRRRKGVQGRGVEYHINSLPSDTQVVLMLRENPDFCQLERQEPLKIWVECYYQLSLSERREVMTFLMREGIMSLFDWIAERTK